MAKYLVSIETPLGNRPAVEGSREQSMRGTLEEAEDLVERLVDEGYSSEDLSIDLVVS